MKYFISLVQGILKLILILRKKFTEHLDMFESKIRIGEHQIRQRSFQTLKRKLLYNQLKRYPSIGITDFIRVNLCASLHRYLQEIYNDL